MLLFNLCVTDGTSSVYWECNSGNVVQPEDLHSLAFKWDQHKLDNVERIQWPKAQDLVLWCLQADPNHRPQGFGEVLQHPFFGGRGQLKRMLAAGSGSTGEQATLHEHFAQMEDFKLEEGSNDIDEAELRSALENALAALGLETGAQRPHETDRVVVRASTAARTRALSTEEWVTVVMESLGYNDAIKQTAIQLHDEVALRSALENALAALGLETGAQRPHETDRVVVRALTAARTRALSTEEWVTVVMESLGYYDAIKQTAIQLHTYIAKGDSCAKQVEELFDANIIVHYNLTVQCCPDILPLHRAAKSGAKKIMKFLLEQTKSKKVKRDRMDEQRLSGYTCLHWAARYGHHEIAAYLIEEGCNTSLRTDRGHSAWELAELFSNLQLDETQGQLKADTQQQVSKLKKVLEVFEDRASKDSEHKDHTRLMQEQIRREMRPKIHGAKDMSMYWSICDDPELDPTQFMLWGIKSKWDQWDGVAEGSAGQIYKVKDLTLVKSTAKNTSDGKVFVNHLYETVALKVPKRAQNKKSEANIKTEVEQLGRLEHPNVVKIIGYLHGPDPTTKKGEEHKWMMCLEFCDTDIYKLLYSHAKEDETLYEHYSLQRVLVYAEQIANALLYVHGEMKMCHLDVKPKNCLLSAVSGARESGAGADDDNVVYVAKLADFSFAGVEATDETQQSQSDDKATAGSGNDGSASIEKVSPIGSWEYMAPECWKRKYGKPDFASDIFAFGLLLWEMVARARVYTAFPGIEPDIDHGGEPDVKLVPARLVNGQRPPRPANCPELLYKLMQACWVHPTNDQPGCWGVAMAKRPKAAELLVAMRTIQKTEHALELPTEATADDVAKQAPISFDDFLSKLGMQEKKDALAEWDIKEKPTEESAELGPLEKLQGMLTEEREAEGEDFADMVEEIFNEDEKDSLTAFRAAVEQLLNDSSPPNATEEDDLEISAAWQSLLKSLDLDATKLEKEVLAVATTGRP
jgi:serine/threonine protein kinase